MDIQSFRRIVDGTGPGVAACDGDLQKLYDYVGLAQGSAYSIRAVSDALHARIPGCFTSGHAVAWRVCKSLRVDLIREHVLLGLPLTPYIEIIDHLQDAVRSEGDLRAPLNGDWNKAIQNATDHVQISSWGAMDHERLNVRDFAVAKAARTLRDSGFPIRLEPGIMSFEEGAESKLIAAIEDWIRTMGGINVARRIFKELSPLYDPVQQRYHVVPHISTTGGGAPQVPWGYLIQLAVKHVEGRKPYTDSEAQWHGLLALATAYATFIDVQPYTPSFYGTMDATALVPYLQDLAIHDTLFRITQTRPSDVVKIARGMFDWVDMSLPTKAGWSIDQVLEIVDYMFAPIRDVRGPIFVTESEICRACSGIPREKVAQILDSVLSHSTEGANQNFSRPTDAPDPKYPELKDAGLDFMFRPLLRLAGRRFLLLDRSVCAPACLEALLIPLRPDTEQFDDKVGKAVERFLAAELVLHGVAIERGDYDVPGAHGECDLVIETPETVFFAEVKKKPLTRRAKAGSDANLLLDLAGSLVAAQAQAGWHEVRLRQRAHLDLLHEGITTRVELNARGIERVAVSLFDFGGLQDRILLKQFLEAAMNAQFSPAAVNLNKGFKELNSALAEIRDQIALLNSGEKNVRQPFFNCWFLSVPQLLVLMDGVIDGAGFRNAIWHCRHIVTGSSDVYFDLFYMKGLKKSVVANS